MRGSNQSWAINLDPVSNCDASAFPYRLAEFRYILNNLLISLLMEGLAGVCLPLTNAMLRSLLEARTVIMAG